MYIYLSMSIMLIQNIVVTASSAEPNFGTIQAV